MLHRSPQALNLPYQWGNVRFKNPATWLFEFEEATHVDVDKRLSNPNNQKKRSLEVHECEGVNTNPIPLWRYLNAKPAFDDVKPMSPEFLARVRNVLYPDARSDIDSDSTMQISDSVPLSTPDVASETNSPSVPLCTPDFASESYSEASVPLCTPDFASESYSEPGPEAPSHPKDPTPPAGANDVPPSTVEPGLVYWVQDQGAKTGLWIEVPQPKPPKRPRPPTCPPPAHLLLMRDGKRPSPRWKSMMFQLLVKFNNYIDDHFNKKQIIWDSGHSWNSKFATDFRLMYPQWTNMRSGFIKHSMSNFDLVTTIVLRTFVSSSDIRAEIVKTSACMCCKRNYAASIYTEHRACNYRC